MHHNKIILFEEEQIRREYFNDEWYFSIVDIIGVLSESTNPTDYLKKMRKREPELNTYLGTNCPQIGMVTSTGKLRKTLAGNTEHLFRVIQSIPSSRAEPVKRWLSKIGYERVQEIENPELAQDRMKLLYEEKGYTKDWIDKRLRGMAIRQNLTDEWQERGVTNERDYAILTAEISRATFGITPSEYRAVKGLSKKSQNLRDHMTDFELIFTMLGEKVTTEISQNEQPDTFHENKQVARRGGAVAGVARKETEKELGHSIVSQQNFLDEGDEQLKIDKSK